MPEGSWGPQERLVVIGNGMAGMRAVEELLARAPGRYAVTVFGAEPQVNYNRIMLSPVLSGEKKFEDIIVHDDAWYERHRVDLCRGETVVAIDRAAKTIRTDSGNSISCGFSPGRSMNSQRCRPPGATMRGDGRSGSQVNST